MSSAFPVAALIGLLAMLSGCSLLDQLDGQDPVKGVKRDNPFDPQSSQVLVFGLDSPSTTVGTVRPSINFRFTDALKSYSLQINETDDFSGTLVYEETGITEPTHQLTRSLANHGHYFWRVSPRYESGNDAGWSEARELKVELGIPGQLSPANGSEVLSPFPWLTWEATTGSYEVQVADDAAFTTNMIEQQSDTAQLKIVTGWNNGSAHYWRVRTVDHGVGGGWSAATLATADLPQLSLTLPEAGGSVHDMSFSSRWQNLSTPPDARQYQIEINPSSGFDAANSQFITINDMYSGPVAPVLSLGTVYHWRMRTLYAQGILGPWSASASFFRDWVSKTIKFDFMYSSPRVFALGNGAVGFVGDNGIGSVSSSGTVTQRQTSVNILSGNAAVDSTGVTYATVNYHQPAGVMAWTAAGTLAWTYETPYNSMSGLALAKDGTVYTTHFGGSQAPTKFYFVALTKNGAEKWRREYSDGSAGTDSVVITTDGTVCFSTTQRIYALDAQGTERWNYPIKGAILSAGASGSLIAVDPAASSSSGFGLSVLDSSGNLVWRRSGGARTSTVVDADGNLYLVVGNPTLGSSTALICLDSAGNQKWQLAGSAAKKLILGNNGVLYALDRDANFRDFVQAIDVSDGSVLWTNPCLTGGIGSASDMTLSSDGKLYVIYNNHFDVIPTSSTGVAASPWPMTGHDVRSTRSAQP